MKSREEDGEGVTGIIAVILVVTALLSMVIA